MGGTSYRYIRIIQYIQLFQLFNTCPKYVLYTDAATFNDLNLQLGVIQSHQIFIEIVFS